MTTPVLICDDSSFARKQMARALPSDLDVSVTFAGNGEEGLQAIKAGKGDLLFLDLNMPVMDGYEVLKAIREQDLPTMVIVVSGDIQPDAYQRVMKMGALEFVKKPVKTEEIVDILDKYGIRSTPTAGKKAVSIDFEVDSFDGLQEIANIAMGQAADLLAKVLGAFVVMPIPKVRTISAHELQAVLTRIATDNTVSGLCQGFIGPGVAGEALLTFNKSSFTDMAELVKYKGEIDDTVKLELLMDVASILIGACLNSISEQLDIGFSQGHPIVLGHHIQIEKLIDHNSTRWNNTLAIELGCRIENRQISCDLVLLFTEDSVKKLNDLFSYIAK